MSSSHLVDAQLVPILDILPATTLTLDNLADFRAGFQFPVPQDVRASVSYRDIRGPGRHNLELQIVRPANATGALPTLYHIHGGGFVGGSVRDFAGMNAALVDQLGCALVSVNYRLAPETPFPGAIEDCYAGLSWVYAQAAEEGFDTQRLGIMGESAGGGLAAALCLMVRDRGEFKPQFQHLIYPMLDDRTCVRSDPHPYTGEFVWSAANNRFGWTALLGREPGGEGVSAYAAPARADNLEGLPPAFILTGALDLFLEENLEYGRRLTRAGVPLDLHVFSGAFHAFDIAAGVGVADDANRIRVAALKRALFG